MGTHDAIILFYLFIQKINQIVGNGTLFSGGEFTKIIPFEIMYRFSIRIESN
jgi:hypothetical protein